MCCWSYNSVLSLPGRFWKGNVTWGEGRGFLVEEISFSALLSYKGNAFDRSLQVITALSFYYPPLLSFLSKWLFKFTSSNCIILFFAKTVMQVGEKSAWVYVGTMGNRNRLRTILFTEKAWSLRTAPLPGHSSRALRDRHFSPAKFTFLIQW